MHGVMCAQGRMPELTVNTDVHPLTSTYTEAEDTGDTHAHTYTHTARCKAHTSFAYNLQPHCPPFLIPTGSGLYLHMFVFASAGQVVPNIAPSGKEVGGLQLAFRWTVLCPSFPSLVRSPTWVPDRARG